jgi:hypothetical protein
MVGELDLTEYAQPLKVAVRIEDMKLCSDVSITGQLKFSGGNGLKYAYEAANTFVSSALLYGDLYASYTNYYSQRSSGQDIWNDVQQETNTTAQYNLITYPIQVTNKGAVKEKWALIFTSATGFTITGETRGQIDDNVTNGIESTEIYVCAILRERRPWGILYRVKAESHTTFSSRKIHATSECNEAS